MIKKYIKIGLPLLIILGILIFLNVPRHVDKSHNFLYPQSPQLDIKIPDIHTGLFIADLHSDSLLWNRELTQKSNYGHVDFPRLQEGNIALQIFSAVTKTPRGININSNTGETDNITLLAIAQRWPWKTWSSLSERALYQAQSLKIAVDNYHGFAHLILTKKDLKQLLVLRKTDPKHFGVMLSIEGGHALEGDMSKLDELYEAGFRIISPAHMFDTELSGSQQGKDKYGLTSLGKEWLKKMNAKNMIVDLAHASEKTIEEVLMESPSPVMISHTGARHVCSNNRNLTDEQIKKITQKGGIIGVGFWYEAVCGKTVTDIVNTISHIVQLTGPDYVALGSDWDGYVATPLDASQTAALTQALLDKGFESSIIKKIMGENALQFLMSNLPD